MQRTQNAQKVAVWAVDVTDEELPLAEDFRKDMKQLIDSAALQIQPVHVFDNKANLTESEVQKRRTSIDSFLSRLDLTATPVRILGIDSRAGLGPTACLKQYARSAHADYIMVSSHGRRGVARVLLGSFAERLVRHSHLPILFFNHAPRPVNSSIKVAMFATDFGPDSQAAFQLFLRDTKGIAEKIVVFHEFNLPYQATPFGAPIAYGYLESLLASCEADGKAMVKRAHEAGFEAIYIQGKSSSSVPSSIYDVAQREGVGLIALSADLGPVASILLGSFARNLIHRAQFPLMIYGPTACGRVRQIDQTKHKKSQIPAPNNPNLPSFTGTPIAIGSHREPNLPKGETK